MPPYYGFYLRMMKKFLDEEHEAYEPYKAEQFFEAYHKECKDFKYKPIEYEITKEFIYNYLKNETIEYISEKDISGVFYNVNEIYQFSVKYDKKIDENLLRESLMFLIKSNNYYNIENEWSYILQTLTKLESLYKLNKIKILDVELNEIQNQINRFHKVLQEKNKADEANKCLEFIDKYNKIKTDFDIRNVIRNKIFENGDVEELPVDLIRKELVELKMKFDFNVEFTFKSWQEHGVKSFIREFILKLTEIKTTNIKHSTIFQEYIDLLIHRYFEIEILMKMDPVYEINEIDKVVNIAIIKYQEIISEIFNKF